MQEEKEKKERKSVPVKGMRRNKTTVNFNRSKLDKADKSDTKGRKSIAPKKTGEAKAKASEHAKTEGNEKKGITKSASKKDVLSKTMRKPLTKSKTLATISPKKKNLTPKKEKKKDDKKDDEKKDKKDDKTKKDDKAKKDEKPKKDDKTKKDD